METAPICFEDIYSLENLYHAWHKVSLGKSGKSSIIDFYRNLDANLASIAKDLRNESYKPSPYNQFLIKDPKERVISASIVRDRVVQHALMNLYDPVFDRRLVFDTYACRINKGTQKAVLRAFHFSKGFKPPYTGYFLKMDVRKYFDSIDHLILKQLLSKIIKNSRSMDLFNIIIDSNSAVTEKGLPIGNLTSQYFANHYLSAYDHYVKEKLRIKKYLRYMDDILIFSDSKPQLKDHYAESVSYAGDKLNLSLKPAVIDGFRSGAPFLGFLIKPTGIYLQKKLKTRYKSRVAEIEHSLKQGSLSALEAGRRLEAVTAHLLLARSRKFRNTVLRGRAFGY
jgi:retron-type reverse transcriptase